MKNFTEAQKKQLETVYIAGGDVLYYSYDPATVIGDPEGDAIADGWVEFYREDDSLVEVIYKRP